MVATYIAVVHEGYGCESGCCGYAIQVRDEKDSVIASDFSFYHKYDDTMTNEEFWESNASELKRKYNVPVRYSECDVVDC